MATNDVTQTVEAMFDGMVVLKDIGVDTEGRSHHYDPAAHEIVVFDGDARGDTSGHEEIRRVEVSENSTGAWDYIEFVEDEVDGLEWAETDAPRQPPEADR